MKKIYILTAIFALLTLSLNAQTKSMNPVDYQAAPTEKVEIKPDGYFRMGPSRASSDPVTPRYSNGFSSEDEWNWWEVINSNGGHTWVLSGNQAQYHWDTNQGADDWLITAPVRLEAGKTYKFYIDVKAGGNYTERIEVKMASNNTETALSGGTQIINAQDVTNTNYNTLSNENITVSTTGNYYFGIHAISTTDRYYLYVDNLVIDVVVTDPTIRVSDNTVNLMCKANETATETVTVTGLNLTTGITATLNDPNNVFSINTSTLGTSGGNLTVTYSPTASGTHTATLTLSSTGAESVTVNLNGSCVKEKTICDGTERNENLPIYGYYYDNYQKNQMIYPESELTALEGTVIKSMTFYAAQNFSFSGGTLIARLGTTDQTSYSSKVRLEPSDIKIVASGFDVPSGGQTWTIVFSDGFEYDGGNLVVDMEEISHGSGSGSYTDDFYFYGITQTGGGFYSYGSTKYDDFSTVYSGGSVQNFLPKVTFGYVDAQVTPTVDVSPESRTINDSGTNNTFTVQGSNLGTDNVGLTQTNNEFTPTLSTTTGTYYDGGTYWGFTPANGAVNGTVAMNYNGRALSASNTVTLGNNTGASATFTVNYVPDLYIVTDNGENTDNGHSNNNWVFTNGTQMTNNDGTYTATFTATVDNTYILFARKLGNDVYWDTRYVFGPNSSGTWAWGTYTGGNIDVNDDDPIKLPAGTYTVTIDANAGTFTITKLVPDLAITLSAPAMIVGGNTATVTATVTNNGEAPATGYTVTFTADGTTISTQNVTEPLAVGATATYTAEYATTAAQVGNTVSFAVNVACTDDANASNNNATASMNIISMPPPENVVATGDSETQTATVTWDVPSNLPTYIDWVDEGFDDETVFIPFSTGGITADNNIGTIGGWTLYDGTNGATPYGSTEIEFPNESQPMAWIVFNSTGATPDPDYPNATAHAAHSDNQYMESIVPLSSSGFTSADHWLISPELSGNAQTITWWDSELTTKWGSEYYEVWISTTDNNRSSFTTKLEDYTVSVSTWTQQELQLPADTKYFAFRHTSSPDYFGLLIDDVRYEALITEEPESYNIYLDGVLVGNVDSSDPLSYDFNNVSYGEHQCQVSAVYPGPIESARVPATFTLTAPAPVLTAPESVNVGTNYGLGVSTTVPVSGAHLTQDLTVSVNNSDFSVSPTSISAADAMAGTTITVTYTGTDPNATATLTIGSGEVSATVNLTASYEYNPPVLTTSPTDGSYLNMVVNQGSSTTQTITVSGEYLTEGLTVSVSGDGFSVSPTTISAADANAGSVTVTVTYNGTKPISSGTLTIGSSEVSATIHLIASSTGGSTNYSTDGIIRMGNLIIVDQFWASTADNNHPEQYSYILRYTPAQGNPKESSPKTVDVEHTKSVVYGYYTEEQIKNDQNLDTALLKMDIISADVKMNLPDNDKDIYYVRLQSKKDGVPQEALKVKDNFDMLAKLQLISGEGGFYYSDAILESHPQSDPGEYHYPDNTEETGVYGVDYKTYVPSIMTYGYDRHYFADDTLHNTYGAPIWKTGVGQVIIDEEKLVVQKQVADTNTGATNPYTSWDVTEDGVTTHYDLYLLGLDAQGYLPAASVSNVPYEPYMFRVFVESQSNSLRKCKQVEGTTGHHMVDLGPITGKYCVGSFDINSGTWDAERLYFSKQIPKKSDTNGNWEDVMKFGASSRISEPNDLKVYVRFYYMVEGWAPTRDGEGAARPGNGSESGGSSASITTGVNELNVLSTVVDVTYYNPQGMQSKRPFDGINIIVTRYSDGTTTTTKVVNAR